MNIQDWFPLGLTSLISLQSRELSRVFPSTAIQKHQFFGTQPSLQSKSHTHPGLRKKTPALTLWTFVGKVVSLLFNTLSRFVIAFFPRTQWRSVSWLQSPSAVILEPEKIKSVNVSTFSTSICHEVMGPDDLILVFFFFFGLVFCYCWVLSKLFHSWCQHSDDWGGWPEVSETENCCIPFGVINE